MNPNVEFKRVDSSFLKNKNLTTDNYAALNKYGFVGWVAPNLYFGEFEEREILPALQRWSWLQDWSSDQALAIEKYGQYIVLGSGPDNEPIVYKQNESTIYLINNSQQLLFINSNIESLIKTASAFLDMVDQALLQNPDSIEHRTVSKGLVNNFLLRLKTIEPKASLSLWGQWASEHSKNL